MNVKTQINKELFKNFDYCGLEKFTRSAISKTSKTPEMRSRG